MAMHPPAQRGPFVPAHRPDGVPLRVLLVGLDADEDACVQAWLRRPHTQVRSADAADAASQALRLLPGVLVVDRCTSMQLVDEVLERCRALTIGVLVLLEAQDVVPADGETRRVFLQRPFNRAQLLKAVEQAAQPWGAPAAMHWHARQLREEADTLLDLALDLASPVPLEMLLQRCAEAARHLTGAAYAALFRHGGDGAHRLAGLSGLPPDAFDGLGMPGDTLLLAPTFAGERVIRCDDVHAHPRYGWNPRHRGVPSGHPPVRSYLAVPVTTREGRLLGALLLGHGEPAVFTARSERLAEAIAAQAAVAIDHHLHHAGALMSDRHEERLRPGEPAARASRPGRATGPRTDH